MAKKPPTSIEVVCSECGSVFPWLPHGDAKPRSPEQHRRFFMGMKLVHESWPDSHPESYATADHLRQWICMKAGWREVDSRIPLEGLNKQQAFRFAKALLSSGDRLKIPVVHGNELIVWRSKSIAFLKMGHLEFCALNNATDDVIKAETGLIVGDLIQAYIKMKKAMAADARGRELAPKHIGEEWMA